MAAGHFHDVRQQERRGRLAMDALLVGHFDRAVDDLVHLDGIHRVFLGDRVADDSAALEADVPFGLHDLGDGLLVRAVIVQLEAGGAAVEGGQLVGAQAENGHAVGLQIFQRQAEVKNALCACADNADRRVGKLLKVGGDIHGLFCAAMHAADTAGRKEADARIRGDNHSRGNGGRAGHTGRKIGRQIAAADLADAVCLAHAEQLLIVQADLHLAVENGDGRGDSALFADDGFHLVRKLQILGIGHTMAQNGGLQRDNGLVFTQGLLNFGGDGQILMQIVHS